MINKLNIFNFKSHKKTTLEFTSGVNVIVGESDTGKSAIIQALKWLIFNRPSGEAFRSNWGGKTMVGAFVDGSYIYRSKMDDKNEYGITQSKKTKSFVAFKSNIPQEISEALNMDETNLQTQFSQHFLLSNSPGEVAQHFNKVANLDKIDFSISFLSKELKHISNEITSVEAQIRSDLQELEDFIDVDLLERKINSVEKKESLLREIEEEVNNINQILESFDLIEEQISEATAVLKLEKQVDNLMTLAEDIAKINKEVHDLRKHIEDYDYLQEKEQNYLGIIGLEPQVINLISFYEEANKLSDECYSLEKVIEDIHEVEDGIKFDIKVQKGLEKMFHENIGEVCPLCNSKIK